MAQYRREGAAGRLSSCCWSDERELEVLADLLGLAADSGGRVVLIRGEAGIGKSALVELFAESYADTALFVSGSCDDLSTGAVGPIRDIAARTRSVGDRRR